MIAPVPSPVPARLRLLASSAKKMVSGPDLARALIRTLTCLLSGFVLSSCSLFSPKPAPAQAWITTSDGSKLLAPLEPIQPFSGKPTESVSAEITIDSSTTYQVMDGFGASMTESSAYTIASLSEQDQNDLLIRLFDPERGIGISFLRQPMGSPDFALTSYSYDDLEPGETDFNLERFSIDRDREYIIPLLKRALAINPDIKIMASPWSPPAWMKTGRSLLGARGGRLRSDCYDAYARYFVKFIEAYAAEGLPIYAVTPQNEINYAPPLYSGMMMSSAEEAAFIGEHLGPALERAGLSAKIFCYDHNWDHPELPLATLADPEANRYLAGSAWHWYGGSPSVMSEAKARFPDKDIWFTEGGSGRWIGKGTFSGNFRDGMEKGIEICSNWAKSLVWWNIALDQKNGPIVFKNEANYGLVEIRVDPATKRGVVGSPARASWYTLAHFSRFVRPGAERIGSSREGLEIAQVAFMNPDGSRVVVLYNRFFSDAQVVIREGRWRYALTLPEYSAVSLVIPAS